ncbi:bacterial Ig-like domain [bacterium BMS3Abin10]|nr:bacterial Ig-like domain [bacterium BMS3Abin10]
MNSILMMLVLIVVSLFPHELYALTIVSPSEGQVVYQGDRLTVIVKPDTGEDWKEVLIEVVPMSYNFLTNEYKAEIEIPRDETTGIISFSVAGYDKGGKEFLLERSLFVKMPPNVVLQSILVDDYKTLFKLPPGSSPEEMQRIESRQLHVFGIYSDNVNRELTSSASGTTYTSSNEQVVTVSPEGKVTAQGIGKAKITVRNGNFSAMVDVVVKPYE